MAGREMGLRECSSDCRHFQEIINKALKCFPDTVEDLMVEKEEGEREKERD